MNISINGQARDLADGATLHDVVLQFAKRPDVVITELNGAIVDRLKWAETRFSTGDRVELVTFVGGG
jgi:thiamine biosynthesis protein ThiS